MVGFVTRALLIAVVAPLGAAQAGDPKDEAGPAAEPEDVEPGSCDAQLNCSTTQCGRIFILSLVLAQAHLPLPLLVPSLQARPPSSPSDCDSPERASQHRSDNKPTTLIQNMLSECATD